jgi:hypothetical protein
MLGCEQICEFSNFFTLLLDGSFMKLFSRKLATDNAPVSEAIESTDSNFAFEEARWTAFAKNQLDSHLANTIIAVASAAVFLSVGRGALVLPWLCISLFLFAVAHIVFKGVANGAWREPIDKLKISTLLFSHGCMWAWLPILIDNVDTPEHRLIACISALIIFFTTLIDQSGIRQLTLVSLAPVAGSTTYLFLTAAGQPTVFMLGAFIVFAAAIIYHSYILLDFMTRMQASEVQSRVLLERVEASGRTVSLALEAGRSCVVEIDLAHLRVHNSHGVEQVFGDGFDPLILFHPLHTPICREHRRACSQFMHDLGQGKFEARGEFALNRTDGSKRYIEIAGHAIGNGGNHCSLMVTDVTDRVGEREALRLAKIEREAAF